MHFKKHGDVNPRFFFKSDDLPHTTRREGGREIGVLWEYLSSSLTHSPVSHTQTVVGGGTGQFSRSHFTTTAFCFSLLLPCEPSQHTRTYQTDYSTFRKPHELGVHMLIPFLVSEGGRGAGGDAYTALTAVSTHTHTNAHRKKDNAPLTQKSTSHITSPLPPPPPIAPSALCAARDDGTRC